MKDYIAYKRFFDGDILIFWGFDKSYHDKGGIIWDRWKNCIVIHKRGCIFLDFKDLLPSNYKAL